MPRWKRVIQHGTRPAEDNLSHLPSADDDAPVELWTLLLLILTPFSYLIPPPPPPPPPLHLLPPSSSPLFAVPLLSPPPSAFSPPPSFSPLPPSLPSPPSPPHHLSPPTATSPLPFLPGLTHCRRKQPRKGLFSNRVPRVNRLLLA